MKELKFGLRISLRAASIGYAAVWLVNGLLLGAADVPVTLPEVTSDEILIVTPAINCLSAKPGQRMRISCIDRSAGGGGGGMPNSVISEK